MKHSNRLLPLALVLVVAGCDATDPVAIDSTAEPRAAASLGYQTFAQEIVIDHVVPQDIYAGPGPAPTTESSKYSLLRGGIRWFAGGTVEYRITGAEPTAGANVAVVAGEQTYDALVAARSFARNDATSQVNPCTGLPNTIAWTPIDGPGGILGSTAPCYNVATKEIVGFSVMLDSNDSWGTGGAAGVFDVADVATHEFGHAVGLGHVNSPKDGCLTMYKYVIQTEVQKATLGLGDKLGLVVLYGNTDTTPGACGS